MRVPAPRVPPPLPRPLAYLWYGAAGGLCGGAVAGGVEALGVLSTMRPTEYEALAYAWLAYGLIGAAYGAGIGALLVPVGRLAGIGGARAWSVGFGAVSAAVGVVVVRAALGPAAPMGPIGGGFGALALVVVWLGGHLLTKTPLRVLQRPRGTAALWGAGLVVTTMLSLSPAPGALATLTPRRLQAASFTEKPDVVLIVVSGLRADALDPAVLGAPTPALAALAADSVVFEQNVAASAWTRATVGSIFTSMPPSRHHATEGVLPEDTVTLAELLRDGGYATGGLPGTPELTTTWGLDQGFDWYPFAPDHPLGASASASRLTLYGLGARIYARFDPTERVEHHRPSAERLLDEGRAFLDANRGDRAFLFVHLQEPQGPFFPDPPDGTAYTREAHPMPAPEESADLRRRYAVEVARVDAALGRFFAALKADSRYDPLLVVVTGAQGIELLDHGAAWDGATLYDELLHVPLLVKLPGNARAGTRVPWQVRQIDLAPTVADLTGFEAAPAWEGTTLFEDAFDDHLALLSPPEFALDETDPPFAPPTWATHPGSRDAFIELERGGASVQAVRSGGRKLVQVLRRAPGVRRLPSLACFDLLADPGETRDLTRDDPSCPAEMAGRLAALGSAPAATSAPIPEDE